jgi:hypothetical protein
MAAAFVVAGRVALSRSTGALGLMGAMVFAYDVGALAMTFNYPLFIGQSGLEFWILNACLFAAWDVRRRLQVPTPVPRVRIVKPRAAKARALPAVGEAAV